MTTNSMLTMLLQQIPPAIPEGAEVMVATVKMPPGDPGTPPHRHSGPVFAVTRIRWRVRARAVFGNAG
jgi:hypothetical protein